MATVSDYFGSMVFDDRVMRAKLPADVYQSLRKTTEDVNFFSLQTELIIM